MGTQLPLPKKGVEPQFLAHVCCGQMAAWIKMPFDMEVGLGPGDCVTWGPSSPFSTKEAEPLPNFRPMSIVARRLNG